MIRCSSGVMCRTYHWKWIWCWSCADAWGCCQCEKSLLTVWLQSLAQIKRQRSIHVTDTEFLADRTNGRTYATVLRPSIVCDVMYCG